MCGRFTHLYTWKQLHKLMSLVGSEIPLPRRYNVAPTQDAPVVVRDRDGSRHVEMLRWGLIPWWAKDASTGNQMINARAETAATTPGHRDAFKERRCLVPVSGFYEWQTLDGASRKQPWYITMKDTELFALAGLHERWKSEDGDIVRTFTILTTTPNPLMAPLHDRMPVIIAPENYAAWLDPSVSDAAVLEPLMGPFPEDKMQAHRVTARVNKPAKDDPACITPIDDPEPLLPGL